MQIDLDQKILNLDGEEIPVNEKGDPLTLKKVICEAMLTSTEENRNATGEDKARRYGIAISINKGGTQDIKVDVLSEIRKAIGQAYPPLVVGPAYSMLEV